jgi:hypothetical protein
MEQIYPKYQKQCKLVKAKPQTVQFILNYSKALHIQKIRGMTLESNLN